MEINKYPDGTSYVSVGDFGDKGYILSDQVDWESEKTGALQTIFKDGKFFNQVTLEEIRNKLN